MRSNTMATLGYLVFVMLPTIVVAQTQPATNPAQFFEESFGATYRKAVASREFDDDLDLARQIFAASQTLKTESSVPVSVYLCDRVFALASSNAAGHDLALKAMEHRIAILPSEAAATRQRVELFLRRNYARERADGKVVAGARLINYLMLLGDLKESSSDFGGAARLYLQAQRFAKVIESPDLTVIAAKATEATDRERIEQRIEAAQERYVKGIKRADAADELVQIYLLEFGQPADAARYSGAGTDEQTERLVPLLLKDAEDVETTSVLELAQFTEKIASEASPRSKLFWVRLCRDYYEWYTLDPGANELSKLKASVVIKQTKADIRELDPEDAKTIAAADDKGQIDLIQGAEMARHTVVGAWQKATADEVSSLIANAIDERAQFMLPVLPDDSYELSLNFIRTEGDGETIIQLPVGDRIVRLVLGGWQGKASGLYPMVDDVAGATADQPTTNKTTVAGHALTSDKAYALKIRVVRKKTNYRIVVQLDDKPLVTWDGPANEFKDDPDWSLWQPLAIGLAARQSDVRFQNIKLKPLRGDSRILPRPKTLVERGVISPRDGSINLLQLWDKSKDVLDGQWTVVDDALTAVPAKRLGRTAFPVAPDSDYSLHLEFTLAPPAGGGTVPVAPVLYLPWGDHGVVIDTIPQRKQILAMTGLTAIDGADIEMSPAKVDHAGWLPDKKYLLDARLALKNEELVIEIDLDGKRYIRWKGNPELLSVPGVLPLKDHRTLGLAVRSGQVSIHAFRFKAIRGNAKITREAPAAVVPVEVVTNTKPIDPLDHFNPKRDRVSGAWQASGGRLITQVNGEGAMSVVNLPVQPAGDYTLKFQWTTTSGRPMIQTILPVAGTAIQFEIGRSHGKFSSLRNVGSLQPFKSTTALRVSNGKSYAFEVTVKTVSDKIEVKVKANGASFLEWKGEPAQLSPSYSTLGPRYNGHAIGFAVTGELLRSGGSISNVRLQMSSGTVKTLE